MSTKSSTELEKLMEEFKTFFRTEEDGSVHIKDHKYEKYAVANWAYKSLKLAYSIAQKDLLETIEGITVENLTWIVRKADEEFNKAGGSTRHWVRDNFLEILDKEGWQITRKPLDDIAKLKESIK